MWLTMGSLAFALVMLMHALTCVLAVQRWPLATVDAIQSESQSDRILSSKASQGMSQIEQCNHGCDLNFQDCVWCKHGFKKLGCIVERAQCRGTCLNCVIK